MRQYRIEEIATVLGAEILSEGPEGHLLSHAETDSRYVLNPERCIFFALDGVHTRGHYFIPELAQRGVKAFVTHARPDPIEGVWILQVSDSLTALQNLAIWHRNRFDIPVVGITGSNGKTITKEWLAQLLSQKYQVCKNPKSYNSQLGVALSVLDLESSHEFGVFEAGISESGEMARLQSMIRPTLGIFTNIGDAHDNGFVGRGEKIREKCKLFEQCLRAIYCGDYPDLREQLRNQPGAICWGSGSYNDIQILQEQNPDTSTKLSFEWKGESHSFVLPFSDPASLENACHAVIAALFAGLDRDQIQTQLTRLQGLRLRMEQREGLHGCVLINDSYSLDLKSLQLALRFLDQQDRSLSRTLVITDFTQRVHDERLLSQIARLAEQFGLSRVVAIGNRIAALRPYLPAKIRFHSFHDTAEFLGAVDSLNFHQECILIKGARVFSLEKFYHSFALSRHDSILEINLAGIAHNISTFKSLLKKETRIMAVVKASAYGSGQYEIARYLEHKGVDYLAVAYPDEGILLREKGIRSRIMVMNTAHTDFTELQEYGLEPEIFSVQQLKRLLAELGNRQIEVHIKIESGMNRLGVQERELDALICLLRDQPQIRLASIFSHLAASSEKMFDDFSVGQFRKFRQAYDQISNALGYTPLAHILNSGGISRHPEMQLDMIRLGIGLYGLDSDSVLQEKLEPVHTLRTRISQIKEVPESETVSYNRSGKLSRDSRIAVLSMGYADGLPRIAGSRAYPVFLHGKFAPIVGVVCMDMCMVDVTDIPEASEGDEVEIFGRNAPIEKLAEISDTIPYEILCGISPRVKRLFVE